MGKRYADGVGELGARELALWARVGSHRQRQQRQRRRQQRSRGSSITSSRGGKGSTSSRAALVAGAVWHSAAAFGSRRSARAAAATTAAGAGIDASEGAAPGWLWALLTFVCSLLLLSLSSCMLQMIGSTFLDGSRLCICITGARRAARGGPRAARATGGSLGQRAGGVPRQHASGGGGKIRFFSHRQQEPTINF